MSRVETIARSVVHATMVRQAAGRRRRKFFSLSCFHVAAAEDLRLSFRASERHVGDIDKCIWEQRDDYDVHTHTKIKEIHIKKLWRSVPTCIEMQKNKYIVLSLSCKYFTVSVANPSRLR